MSPSIGPGRRVQGIAAQLDDLTLRDGSKLAEKIGGGIMPTPTLTRTIDGSSSIELRIHDPDLSFLRQSLVSEKFDISLDDLSFRYIGMSKAGKTLTLTFEDRDVALLREYAGPVQAFREEMTRAEFIQKLVREANPRLRFYCPQLHVKQPIKKEADGKKAKEESDENRGKGVGATKGLTVKGHRADAEQTEIVDRSLRVAEHESSPLKARIALVAALIAESECRNLHYGDSSSVGVLQLLDIHGSVSVRMDVEHCVHLFLSEGFTGQGGANKLALRDLSPAEIATTVQGNRDGGSTYAPYIEEARAWVEAFEGGEGSASIEVTEPFPFKVEKKETYWAAIQRLAKQVNWRAFVSAGTFFYMPEPELIRSEVRLAIDDDTAGIEAVDFDYSVNKPVTEVSVEALVSNWGVPPGAVVTLEDFGPANIEAEHEPPRKNAKGQKQAIAKAVKAPVGNARYLVAKMSAPLAGDSAARKATITLRKPTRKLPEPANDKKTITPGKSALVYGPGSDMGVLQGTPEEIVNQVVEYAHSKLGFSVTPGSVRTANAEHGPTITGGTSDHQGPPNIRWAADISNGVSTPEEAELAAAIAKAFNIPYHGTLTSGELAEATHGGYRMQLIHNTMTGGDHFDHVHFGVAVA